jgi:hypothetical protein
MARYKLPTTANITESYGDPYYREAMFGSVDAPGFLKQITDAAQRSYLGGPMPQRRVAGMAPEQEQMRRMAQHGIGTYLPFISGATQALGESANLYGKSIEGFDPSTGISPYYDPYEENVVQRSIADILDRADEQSAGILSRGVQQVGEGAFGSRGRLQQQELYKNVADRLSDTVSGLRSKGFGTALSTALREHGRQRGAEAGAAGGLGGLASTLSGLGSSLQSLGQQERSELGSLGGMARGIAGEFSGADFENAMRQRMAPMEAIKGMLPAYSLMTQGRGTTQTQQDYEEQRSPWAEGIGTFMSAYGALNPQQSSQDRYYDTLTQRMRNPQPSAPQQPAPVSNDWWQGDPYGVGSSYQDMYGYGSGQDMYGYGGGQGPYSYGNDYGYDGGYGYGGGQNMYGYGGGQGPYGYGGGQDMYGYGGGTTPQYDPYGYGGDDYGDPLDPYGNYYGWGG